jgi:hypothetical protein
MDFLDVMEDFICVVALSSIPHLRAKNIAGIDDANFNRCKSSLSNGVI